ncbi:MAG: hypothetical protein HQL43_07680 [Alphaproteobacteria bacterium]|nr:hypothetical protein [Alphaproteobacteria bacterium]
MNEKHLPTPEQHADIVVRQLENFIREQRGPKGVNFSSWQSMARKEISDAIRAHKKGRFEIERVKKRMAAVVAACLVTVGFWAMTIFVDRAYGSAAAMVAGAAGLILGATFLEWMIRRAVAQHMAETRAADLTVIDSLDKKIKRIKREKEKKLKEMDEEDQG